MRAGYEAQPLGKARPNYLLRTLCEEMGFLGNRENYYESQNSFLSDVLDRRTGLPIMLSLVCMAVGRRLGAEVDGIGFPNHFMARYRDSEGEWLLDAFNGQLLLPETVSTYLSSIFGQSIQLSAAAFRPMTAALVAQRILNNLRNVYLAEQNYVMATRTLDFSLALTPLNPLPWQERALLHLELQEFEPASRDLRRYFFLTGQLGLALGIEEEQVELEQILDDQERQLFDTFNRIEEMRTRLN
ncbi:MAG: hypothetical protein HC802_09185 [Caldilineaceae bacterium]|nr:hypothetical protein [Caldilineaceae bacterium]